MTPPRSAAMAVKLHLDGIGMTFAMPGGEFRALASLDLSIGTGRFVSLVGPSGCGKSTAFNIIAGLLPPSEGRVLIDGMDATGTIGRVSYMLQKDLLLAWRTVLDNVILGMEIRGTPKHAAREHALAFLQRYGLGGFEHSYPSALSGGMRQRAALLRTLLVDTDVILLDEPFAALDAQTSTTMQEWLLQIWARFRQDRRVRHPRRGGGDLSLRRDPCYGGPSGPHHRELAGHLPRPRGRSSRRRPSSDQADCLALLGSEAAAEAA